MADQIKVTQLDVLADPINSTLYIVKDGTSYQISYDDLFQYVSGITTIKADSNVAVTTGSNVIPFSSPFTDSNISIFIYDINGVGIQLQSWTASNFTINSLGNGSINYIAAKNV